MKSIFDSSVIKLLVVAITILFSSCMNHRTEFFVISSQMYECGNTALYDSIHAQFRFRNISADTVRLMLMPECDCTTLNTEYLVLAPHDRSTVHVSAKVNRAGEYVKNIFVQKEYSESFITLSVHGNAISTE